MKISKFKTSIILFLIILTPWLNANYFDDINIQNNYLDSSFFEINPCKVSFFEFLNFEAEIASYELVNDSYSSILCFGRISQVKNFNTFFIGTNLLINIIIYVLIITQLLKLKYGYLENKKSISLKYLSIISLIFCSLIFSDRKFYETKLYFLDPFKFRSYVFLYFFIFCISYLLIETYFKYEKHIINILPFLIIFTGIVSNSNFNIFVIIFLYLGIEHMLEEKKILKYFKFYLLITFVWSINAREVYIYDLNSYIGFSATSYDFYSIFFYSIFFFIIFLGIDQFIRKSIIHFSYQKFMSSFTFVIIFYASLYILQKKFPVLKIFVNIFFGFRNNINSTSNNLDLINNDTIFFIYCFLFLLKFFNTYRFNFIDILAIIIIAYWLSNFPNYIYLVQEKLIAIEKFFSIYEPTFLEIVLGSGPLNFNQLYLESNQQSLIFQHSFIVSSLLFFGLLGFIFFSIYLFQFMRLKNRLIKNKIFTLILVFNFLINDSINYLFSLIIFILLFSILKNVDLNKFGLSKYK